MSKFHLKRRPDFSRTTLEAQNASSSLVQEHASANHSAHQVRQHELQTSPVVTNHSLARIAVSAPVVPTSIVSQQGTLNTEAERVLQRTPFSPRVPDEAGKLEAHIRGDQSAGQPLDEETQLLLEQELDTDLSQVRVHTDTLANRMAHTVNAVAFTTGRDIFFSQNTYNPHTPQGQHLLAHEVTHVLQQQTQPVTGTFSLGNIAISSPEDRFERAAEVKARDIMTHRSQTPEPVSGQRPTAPSPVSTKATHPGATMVVQRAATAKDPLPQGNTPDNAIIPDLPQPLAVQLQAACTSTSPATDRQAVLTDLYNHLRAAGILDTDVLRIDYANTTDFYGLTDFVDAADATNIQTVIQVSSKAFNDGAPIVYSTIRHEAIHAEQMKGIENKPANPASTINTPDATNDEVNYIDRGRMALLNGGGGGNGTGTTGGSSKKRKKPATPREGHLDRTIHAMQEIETYVWEIDNANKTGTAGDTAFLKTRYESLNAFYLHLCLYARQIGPNQRAVWRDYIIRAKGEAERVLSALPTPHTYGITYTAKTIW